MKVHRTPAEREQIIQLLQNHPTFYKALKHDWTKNVMEDLRYKLYGKIPRNFLINISGLISNPTGIFKSTMGLQIALSLDPNFDLHKRVAFSINELLRKVQDTSEYILCESCYSSFSEDEIPHELYDSGVSKVCDNCGSVARYTALLTKLIYFLDEQTKSLRTGGLTRLKNLVDTCRQRQICFITCGVEQYGVNFTTYQLKRLQESSDMYLPRKTVRYAVYDDVRDLYYGYFQWDIIPLTDPRWKSIWDEYSKMKTDFQRRVMAQQTSSATFEQNAEEVMRHDDFQKCFKITKSGDNKLDKNMIKTLIFKMNPDLTENEREMILSEIKLMMYEDE